MSPASRQDGTPERQDLEALQPQYEWRLRELMALRRNWYTTTKLGPELRKYGFDLDRSNIYRLVAAERPPKMPVELILALCKILKCTFEDLVVEIEPDKAAGESPPAGPRPSVPDISLLSADFFDAES